MSKRHFFAIAALSAIILCGASLYFYEESENSKQATKSPEAVRPSTQSSSPSLQGPKNAAPSIAGAESAKDKESSSSRRPSEGKPSAMAAAGNRSYQGPQIESSLLVAQSNGSKQSVDDSIAQSVLKSSNFADIVRSYQDKAAEDSTVSDLNNAYRSAITDQLAGIDTQAKLDSFACSIQTCVGEIDAGNDSNAWDHWVEKLSNDERTKYWTMIPTKFTDSFGNIRFRFIMSIDPNINGVQAQRP